MDSAAALLHDFFDYAPSVPSTARREAADKLVNDLSLARHDAVMAESALRVHLTNNSLAAVPAEGLDALIKDSAAIIGRCREALETLARLSSRAKALGVQS